MKFGLLLWFSVIESFSYIFNHCLKGVLLHLSVLQLSLLFFFFAPSFCNGIIRPGAAHYVPVILHQLCITVLHLLFLSDLSACEYFLHSHSKKPSSGGAMVMD